MEIIEPTIIEKDQMILVGFSFFGDPFAMSGDWTEENEIGRLWKRFDKYMENNGSRIKYIKRSLGLELHIEHEETAAKGIYEVFVGMEVEKLEDMPVQVLIKILPPTSYAVFTFKGKQITSDWPRMIHHEWMQQSKYQAAYKYEFQLYDERFKGLQNIDESEIDVYIPVKLKNV
jgi:AraC family transcriptional regulator